MGRRLTRWFESVRCPMRIGGKLVLPLDVNVGKLDDAVGRIGIAKVGLMFQNKVHVGVQFARFNRILCSKTPLATTKIVVKMYYFVQNPLRFFTGNKRFVFVGMRKKFNVCINVIPGIDNG